MPVRRSRRRSQPPWVGPWKINRNSSQAAGLVHWHPLRSGDGQFPYDAVLGFNYSFGVVGGVSFSRAGLEFGGAYDFNGSTGYLAVVPSYTSYPFTLSCWFWADGLNNTTVMCLANAATPLDDVHAVQPWSDGVIYATSANGGVGDFASVGTYAANRWNHTAAVFASATERRVYLNGVRGTDNSTSVANPALDAMDVGSQHGAANFFDGRVFDARLYGRALGDGDAKALHDPATRWELYAPQRRIVYGFVPPAAGRRGDLLLLGCGG